MPHDVVACLRLALWDEEKDRMVSYAELTPDERKPSPGKPVTTSS